MAGETDSLSWLRDTTSSSVCMWLLYPSIIKELNFLVKFRVKFMALIL